MAGEVNTLECVEGTARTGGVFELNIVKDERGWTLDPPFCQTAVGAKAVAETLRKIADIIEADRVQLEPDPA